MYFKTFFLLATARVVLAKVQFLGVAIAGGDFGCQIDGSCPLKSTQLPNNNDGVAQMQHFVKDDGINILRLPISWQFLVNDKLGGNLDSTNLAKYDQLVQSCLATGAHCMIDIHNFARWNGGIIGQGGPTDDQFTSLWSQLAKKYAGNQNVVFELMNEPHDLDIGAWVNTCQKAVTAIRQAGATSQMILLPGTNFDSAATITTTGGASQLLGIKNPDGTTDNLILDIHKYLDIDNSGTHSLCTTDNTDAFASVAQFLRTNGRKGFVSETGASKDASCLTAFCAQNTLINQNSDVFIGLVGWAAGSFDTSYLLSLTPSKQNGGLVDNQQMKQCLLGTWVASNSNTTEPRAPEPSSSLPPVIISTATLTSAPLTASTPASTSVTKAGKSSEPVITVEINSATSVLRTESVPSSVTTLIIANGSPSDESYSLAWATSTTSQTPTQTRAVVSATATGSASSMKVLTFIWSCMMLPFLI
ncbi:glycoside hydrolase family 5 protein [Annulohypoxylon maeteangense]|uniref:glycoside hydrolase family 5 protein n=1 Tax=Annulohypoxylon maeteangense TaxID=1927788 RepID=UPI0020086093|nr:glycoside hydrolase family 5 protein [Annulohypoxylon maeteangense]KAI0883503.1 glycoside hydrolase family 5 protein [Annulohypoxylon maeteangense]